MGGKNVFNKGNSSLPILSTVPPYKELTQLWIAMPRRHQVCEKKESMGGNKGKRFDPLSLNVHQHMFI